MVSGWNQLVASSSSATSADRASALAAAILEELKTRGVADSTTASSSTSASSPSVRVTAPSLKATVDVSYAPGSEAASVRVVCREAKGRDFLRVVLTNALATM